MEQNTRAGVLEQFIASRLPYSEVERRVREGFNVSKNTIEISANGYWVINGEKTEYKATGTDGKGIQSATIKNGELILTYTDGKSDNLGKIEGGKGDAGYTPYIQDGFWYINGENLGVKAEYSIDDYPVQSVNNKQGDVQLTAADVGARPDTWTPSADEVGARPASWMPTATEVGAHPNTWIPTAEQVGARPDTWTPSASDVGARPNTWTPTYAEVGADKEGTASAAVSGHNTNSEAHNDIRLELKALADRIAAVLDSDDTTLDELSEIVAYIKSNKSLIDSITTSKVNVADIINNLTSNVTNKPLSAAQGVALKGLYDALQQTVTALGNSKLDSSALTNAINTALAQAKTSGEFDGKDGENGTSVTVKSVSESSADGGSNVVTFSDGKTVTIKNGNKGDDGENGVGISSIERTATNGREDTYTITLTNGVTRTFIVTNGKDGEIGTPGKNGTDGKTPVKGVDYFTEGDISDMVTAVMNAIGTPLFGVIDENNHITFSGKNIPDGTYTWDYKMENGSKVPGGTFVLDTNVYYTVTKTLTYCTISNSATKVVKGEPYNATITANDGYELKSVTVTMGGANVSVTNGVINIANVTGNIVISAVATEKVVAPSYTNLFVANKSQINKRVNSSNNVVGADGYVLTNFIDVSNKTPFTNNTKLYVKGATPTSDFSNGRIITYKSTTEQYTDAPYSTVNASAFSVTNEGGGVYSINNLASPFASGVKRFCMVLGVKTSAITGNDIEDIIITIDEPIV